MHNLTSILNDTRSSFQPVALSYSIAGKSATVHQMLMQKSDGTYELVVWNDRPVGEGSNHLTVNLGSSFPVVDIYDVTSGTTPVNTLTNVASVPLTLTDHAMIVKLSE